MPEKTTEELHAFDNSELDALMVSCGRRVYARLLERGGSKETAREGIKAALIHTYRAVQTSGCGDPLEALMYSCAEERQNFLIERAIESTVSEVLSDIGGESAETPARLSASALEPPERRGGSRRHRKRRLPRLPFTRKRGSMRPSTRRC